MSASQNAAEMSQAYAYHEGAQIWVPQIDVVNSIASDGVKKRGITSWRRGAVQSISKSSDGQVELSVLTEDGATVTCQASDCYLQNERDDTVDDLVRSDFLHEPGILHTLKVRYGMDAIYTYSGQILIATNPHKRVRHLYGTRMMAQYRGVPLGELSPHVYAIAEAAFAAMMMDEQRQAILISGESGAGKTESAKMVMQYLAHRAGPVGASGPTAHGNGTDGVSAPIEEQVLESNPLLEAFGNAKTARNDNSSRFGKFVEIDFDSSGRVTGAAISTYLLERSRVVSVLSPERSFHIFYQLCAGADEDLRQRLHLGADPSTAARSFRSLSQSDAFELDDVDDAEGFKHTIDAMRIIGLKEEAIDAAMRCVAAVLHLGNIVFTAGAGDEASIVQSDATAQKGLEAAADLLGVSSDGLLTALTTRAIETRGERIIKRLDVAAASESRDSLSKSLYSRVFDWLVVAINRKIGALGGGGRTSRTIGILDIYGFESFDRNSFEQLCINLANEKLQQAFNAHVFKGEQSEYAEEGIAWNYVDFVDNQDVLDLLEGATGPSGSLGVFPLIDEACRLPRATHQDLAHALRSKLEGKPRFGAPRRDQHAFVVDHYAGEVVYSTDALLDKNRDFVVAEHLSLMRNSNVPLLMELFSAHVEAATGAGTDTGGGADRVSSPTGNGPSGQRRSAFMLSSVGSRFRRQLAGLMGALEECQPHFIRCIKPNPTSLPGSLAPPYVLEQLRAGGVLEAVRIATAGYPTRKPFLAFAQRYAMLLLGASRVQELGVPMTPEGFPEWDTASLPQLIDATKRVLCGTGLDGWQLGRTRVFLRSGQLAHLEGARGRVLAVAAVKIQSAWRGVDARRQLAEARAAATKVQSAWRGYVVRQMVKEMKMERSAIKVQAAWKSYEARSAFLSHRRNSGAVVIQKHWRRYEARQKYLEETEMGRRAAAKAEEAAVRFRAAILIQSAWRRVLAQRYVASLMAQAARFKAVEGELMAATEEKARLATALREAESRATKAEAAAAAALARIATLESQLEETRAELDVARAAATTAVNEGEAGAAAAHEAAAARAAQLEQAHHRAAEALQEEANVAQRGRAAAEAAAAAIETKLREVESQLEVGRAEAAQAAETARERDAEVEALRDQLVETSREKVALQAAAATAAAAAAAEAATALRAAEDKAAAAVAAAGTATAAEVQELKQRLSSAEEEAARRIALLKDAQEKGSRLASRVEALSARAERLEADSRQAAAREAALLQELEGARRAAAVARSPAVRASRLASATTPIRRTITQELDAAASAIEASSPQGSKDGSHGVVGEMPPALAAAVATFTQAAIFRQLPMVTAWSGHSGVVAVPQVVGLLHRCLVQWVSDWRPADVAAATRHLEASIASTAAENGLPATGYWLAASLATGALLKVGSVVKPGLKQLFHLADSFIGFTDLHVVLGAAVGEEVPVNVALLLSDEAKRCARRRSAHVRPALVSMAGNGVVAASNGVGLGAACSPATPASPADAELAHMGGAEPHWRVLLGGIANVAETLRAAGVPAPAVRAVTWATLRYIDGELLNALLLRRDCCSVSAAKALSTGIAALRETTSFIGAEWCCSPEEADLALERSSQAARFLVQGKDDCVRKALKNINILPDLGRLCPSLTFRQVHRLAEHQHDDWLAGTGSAAGSQNLVLLEMLRRLINENPAAGRQGSGAFGAFGTTTAAPGVGQGVSGGPAAAAAPSPGGWVSFDAPGSAPAPAALTTSVDTLGGNNNPQNTSDSENDDDEEEGLLVNSHAPFELFRIQHQLTRRLLTEAAKASIAPPKASSGSAPLSAAAVGAAVMGGGGGMTPPAGGATPCTPGAATAAATAVRSPLGPRLPDGSLPQLSPSKTTAGTTTTPSAGEKEASRFSSGPSSVSLLDGIDQQCVAAGLPEELARDPAFAFLAVT